MSHSRNVRLACLVGIGYILVGCGVATPSAITTPTIAPSPTQAAGGAIPPRPSPTAKTADRFPTNAFAGVSGDPVSDDVAAKLHAILTNLAGGAGMSATLMSADGTWGGATGTADGVRDLRIDDQFAIASITKSMVAAQVMQLAEGGELALEDGALQHLPADLDFDTNGATIRQLLAQRSGIPDFDWPVVDPLLLDGPRRVWTPAEMLAFVPADREPAGATTEYTNTNYLLLGLVIEAVRGRPIGEVLRDGVLGIDGVERLIYQPDEVPTAPMAMPDGASTGILETGGGYLPSLGLATADRTAASMASDAPSLARWWWAFCAGDVVSAVSLTEMTTMHDGYGLGLYNPDPPGTVGHGGEHFGYTSLAGCLPGRGVVFALLVNRSKVDLSAVAAPLIDVLLSR